MQAYIHDCVPSQKKVHVIAMLEVFYGVLYNRAIRYT